MSEMNTNPTNRSDLYTQRSNDPIKRGVADQIVYNSSRRHIGPPTNQDRIDNMRKSYDYGGPANGVTGSPRKNSHIYSSAVEILKNNPKKYGVN
jgi:hypothetical protein